MCLGVRRDLEDQNPEISFVVASDSVLLGELLNGVTTLGGTAKLKREGLTLGSVTQEVPHPEHLKQSLVWSPGQTSDDEMRRCAQLTYDEFSNSTGDKALVCLGSAKSNPVVEIMMSWAFGAEPFETQDAIATSSERKCPFFMRYRDHDPHPPSCFGGTNLSKSETNLKPGIYFETADGNWIQGGVEDKNQTSALVFYIHRESQGRLEMTLAGFSGRATRYLARGLATRAEDFWPPNYNGQGIAIGAFVIQFTDSGSKKDRDILRTDLVATTKVTPIPLEAIEKRLAK
jgi:hypothetical protein